MRQHLAKFIGFLLICLVGNVTAGALEYVDGVLLIRFTEDVVPYTDANGIVKVDDAQIDRIFERFQAGEIEYMFGDYIIQDEEYRYLTRNDYKVIFPSDTDVELVAEEMSRLKGVAMAEVDMLYRLDYVPNDPSYGSQWWLGAIDAPRAWDIIKGDESVIVTALDTGVDWNHPDLVHNIWVNPGEDIDENHFCYDSTLGFNNNPGTSGDWNYLDDDDNGYSEDFIGYDFVDNVPAGNAAPGEDYDDRDNNPMDFDGHGTGVTGAMAAVGDNGIGGAGVAFDCKIMCLRVGYKPRVEGQGSIIFSAVRSAMAYAIDNGASVLNMSFGSGQYSQFENQDIQNAFNNGILVFAAAGNDGVGNLHYPAGYTNVISVASTNSSRQRANFSNWGDWVDIAAPGVGCYTPWFDDRYDSWQGTSVSSPIAAGVGALVVALHPDDWNFNWVSYIINSTDPLNTDHPIGSGEINAYKALTQHYWPELTIEEWSMNDADGNGHPDIGEEMEVTLSISNEEGWQDAENTTVSISFSSDGIDIDNGSINLGTVAGGATVDNLENPLRFTVPEGALDGHFTNFSLSINTDPNEYEIGVSERIMLGTPDLIFVDDEGDAEYDQFIIDNLDQYYYNYVHYDTDVLDAELTTDYLSEYEAIIWMTGAQENPLSDGEISALEGAMDNGVHLFLFGETLNEQLGGTDFYSNYLFASDGVMNGELGLAPDGDAEYPIIPEQSMVLAGPGGAGNSHNPDVINVLGDAVPAYNYVTSEQPGGLYYEDESRKHVYFAFSFESVSGAANTLPRHELMTSILSWFDIAAAPEKNSKSQIPDMFSIEQVYPNPFNPLTNLKISIPVASVVSLKIYDLLGRETASLIDGGLTAGSHEIIWNAAGNSAGIYFAVLESNGHREVAKLAYVK
ncbi:MAG: S8 family serine peptidase [Candidatus Electryonea clarkiae]|nr:S8 family serine peptidase [Candidatus Electryonea clarkiae]MDP8287113.1 S8 family serine peptidase [Candidatus Electryonea clarkiae]